MWKRWDKKRQVKITGEWTGGLRAVETVRQIKKITGVKRQVKMIGMKKRRIKWWVEKHMEKVTQM